MDIPESGTKRGSQYSLDRVLSLDPQNSTDKDAPATAHDIEMLMNSLKQLQTALAELKEAVITANMHDEGE